MRPSGKRHEIPTGRPWWLRDRTGWKNGHCLTTAFLALSMGASPGDSGSARAMPGRPGRVFGDLRRHRANGRDGGAPCGTAAPHVCPVVQPAAGRITGSGAGSSAAPHSRCASVCRTRSGLSEYSYSCVTSGAAGTPPPCALAGGRQRTSCSRVAQVSAVQTSCTSAKASTRLRPNSRQTRRGGVHDHREAHVGQQLGGVGQGPVSDLRLVHRRSEAENGRACGVRVTVLEWVALRSSCPCW
jgi:hypothetical protein